MADAGLGHVPDQLVSEVEAAWGVRFRSGPYVSRPMMRHLWEPVRAFYRPLVFYTGVELLILMKHTMLLAAGFRAHMHGGEKGDFNQGNSRLGGVYDGETGKDWGF